MGKPVNTTIPRLGLHDILKFWMTVSRVKGQGPQGDCWEWTDLRDSDGYGHVTHNGRHLKSHRIAFLLANDYWPHEHVLHRCDNPPCCNPQHLFEGTTDANALDKYRKGRHPHGPTHWMVTQPERVPKGSRRSQTKLTEAKVLEIRKRIENGETQKTLAQYYGVSRSLISRVHVGHNWTHI